MKTNLLLHDDVQVTGWLRFANLIIDTIVILIIVVLISVIAEVIALSGAEGLGIWLESMSDVESRIIGTLFLFLYYFIMEATTQCTVAKYITGTMVVNANGEKPSISAILGRSFCRIFTIEALSFLGNRRGWHDTASNTYVVKTKKWKQLTALENSFDEIGEPEADTVTTSAV